MSLSKLDKQDAIVYGALGLSFAAMLLLKSGDLIQGINNQSLISKNAATAAKDNRVAEQRFSLGCNTGFVLSDGNTNLIAGEVPLDLATRSPLAPGAVLCDRTGATAIVSADGLISDIRVSARVRKTYIDKGLGGQ